MAARRLTLRKDTLAELTSDDLREIAGAAEHSSLCNVTYSCVPCTGYYPSIFDPCDTQICLG
jgi:hypothetical protein